MVEATPLRNRMSESDYKSERETLLQTYGDSSAEANGRREQALARLFDRSGWTQEELAATEGKTRRFIAYNLTFGRFLGFGTSGSKLDFIPARLTERRFRDYWQRTDKAAGNDRQRFQACLDLMKAELSLQRPRRSYRKVGYELRERFADAKWHNHDTIVRVLDAPAEEVEAAITAVLDQQSYGCRAERRPHGKSFQYRITRADGKAISPAQLRADLTPLIEQLQEQANRTAGTIPTVAIRVIADRFAKLLEQWDE